MLLNDTCRGNFGHHYIAVHSDNIRIQHNHDICFKIHVNDYSVIQ